MTENWIKFCNQQVEKGSDGRIKGGFTINKLLVSISALFITCSLLFAASIDPAVVTDWKTGTQRVNGTARIVNTNDTEFILQIDKIETEAVTTTGQSSITAGSASPTNAAVITPTSDVMIITPIGGANDTTNTCTIANAVAGQYLQIIVAGTATNLLGLADSGNLKLSAAAVLDNDDSITFRGVGTNWVESSRSDN